MKRKIFLSGLTFVVIGIGYSLFWQHAAHKFEYKVISLLDDLKSHQCEIKYDRLAIVGFPFKLVAKLKNPTFIKDKIGLASIKVEGNIRAQTSLFNYEKLNFSTRGVTHLNYRLDIPQKSLTMTMQHVEGDIDLWRTGLNRAASFGFESSSVIDPGKC